MRNGQLSPIFRITRTSELHGHPVVVMLHDHTFLGSGKRDGRLVRYSLRRAWEPYAGIGANTSQSTPSMTWAQGADICRAGQLAPMRRGRNDPVAPPLVSVAVRDLDLDRLGFRNLRERDVK